MRGNAANGITMRKRPIEPPLVPLRGVRLDPARSYAYMHGCSRIYAGDPSHICRSASAYMHLTCAYMDRHARIYGQAASHIYAPAPAYIWEGPCADGRARRRKGGLHAPAGFVQDGQKIFHGAHVDEVEPRHTRRKLEQQSGEHAVLESQQQHAGQPQQQSRLPPRSTARRRYTQRSRTRRRHERAVPGVRPARRKPANNTTGGRGW